MLSIYIDRSLLIDGIKVKAKGFIKTVPYFENIDLSSSEIELDDHSLVQFYFDSVDCSLVDFIPNGMQRSNGRMPVIFSIPQKDTKTTFRRATLYVR